MKNTGSFTRYKSLVKGLCLPILLFLGWVVPNTAICRIAMADTSAHNQPPTLTAKVENSYCVGDFVEIQLSGKDPEGDLLTYDVSGLPDGLHLNPSNGLISGVLELNFGAGSSTNYEVQTSVREYFSDLETPSTDLVINIFVISTCGSHVSGFSLIDASTNQSLGPLNEGDILDLHLLPSALSIRANTSSTEEPIESVVFAFSGSNRFRTENIEPYALGGDINGEFLKVNFRIGSNTIEAAPYSMNKGRGGRGSPKVVNFKVIRSTGNRPPQITADVQNFYCRGDRIKIQIINNDPDGDKLRYSIDPRGPLPPNLSIDPISGLISGLLVRGIDDGSSTNYDVLIKVTDPGNLSAFGVIGIFSIDCGVRISSFTLVDAASNKDIRILEDGEVLNMSKLPPHLSIRSDLYFPYDGYPKQSVVFDFNSRKNFRTENEFPYSLGGDDHGDYKAVTFPEGSNTIAATIFNEPDVSHDDISLTINFRVLGATLASLSSGISMSTSTPKLELNLKKSMVQIYPNPFSSKLLLKVFSSRREAGSAELYNTSGQLVRSQVIYFNEGDQQVEINAMDLPSGVYSLHLITNGKLIGKPLKVIRL
ncbi:T9SS type A sorting domain-containing protein [Flavihumibacter sp. R14]|nr:T9SS type A sorting domain-containing protein [Flavihumibacter soli]